MHRLLTYFLPLLLLNAVLPGHAQLLQTQRYELEKKNNDDYFTVIPAGEHGVMIIRDIEKYEKGDVWQLISLDTDLNEQFNTDLALDSKYIFKAFDVFGDKLYLLFREGEHEKKDYHLIEVHVTTGYIERYDIENELALELSHILTFKERILLGGYVNNSPTLVAYQFGSNSFDIVPGYFKDKSELADLTENVHGTFNVVTLEDDYSGEYLKVRTMSYDGEALFDSDIPLKEGLRVLDAKSSGFLHGNLVVSGTYSMTKTGQADGLYLAVVKPGGSNISYYNFVDFVHFFDYMKPKRAARIRENMEQRIARGQDPNYSARMQIQDLSMTEDGYLVVAEIFNPDFDRQNYTYNHPYSPYTSAGRFRTDAAQQYARQPSRLQRVREASSFDYLQSIIFELDKNGRLLWDNSFPITDTQLKSLERVTHHVIDGEKIHMLYKTEDELQYQAIMKSDTLLRRTLPIMLKGADEEIVHTYGGAGKSEYWYGNVFLVWGYHKVDDRDDRGIKARNVLFINKLEVE